MRRLKTKKRRKRRVFSFVFLILLSLGFCYYLLSKVINQNDIKSFLLETSSLKSNKKRSTHNTILDLLLENTIGKEKLENSQDFPKEIKQEYIEDQERPNLSYPILYIYNTHQAEQYTINAKSEEDIIPTVMLASYYLREKMNKLGIQTMVETERINEVLRNQGWDYSSSYLVSRLLLKNAKETYPSLKYYIDLHRDSIARDLSIIERHGKTYAKVLFVVGTDYDNYFVNLNFAKYISESLNKKVENLSRGILTKGGSQVNGVYNQDFSSHMLLIELGGEYNTIEEIKNTIDVLAEVLKGAFENE